MKNSSLVVSENVLIDARHFQRLLGIKKSTFYNWRKNIADFPSPLVFSDGRTVRWWLADALSFIDRAGSAKGMANAEGGAQ